MKALNGEEVDRISCACISGLTTLEIQKITNCFMPEIHSNPEKLVQLFCANHKILGFDGVTFIINYFNEPSAMRCLLDCYDKERLPLYISHPWENKKPYVPEDILNRHPYFKLS